jgi:penicillin-binding protein 1A
LAIPTYGKTGTTQENRDALFIGFAGNLVVGVWVGRDDDTSLGKVSGGTVPAEVWRSFMTSALAIDHDRGPVLPAPRRPSSDSSLKSPLPPEWSNSTKRLREIARQFRTFAGG